MKILRVACLASAMAFSSAARADEPKVPDPRALATVDAMITFCAKADPASAARYGEQIQAIAPNATEDALAKVRGMDEYRKARAAADAVVAQADPRDASQACTQALAQAR